MLEEDGRQVDTVEGPILRFFDTGYRQDGRHDVEGNGQGIGGGPGLYPARPPGNGGDTGTALVDGALVTTMGGMTGVGSRSISVVGKEEEQSVLLESEFHQLGPDLLDPLVHLEDHLLHGLGVGGGTLPGPRPALNGIVGSLDRRMG